MAMKLTHISHGFYRVSDSDAGRLAREASAPLPRVGYELAVTLPNGLAAWLARTPMSSYAASPKRGWAWSVRRRTGKEWDRYALGEKAHDGSYSV